MIKIFLEGLITGIGMLIFVGPVFFTLLQAAFQYGFRSGFAVAFGIFVSDVVCVILCKMGADAFFTQETNHFWIGVAGGILLIGMGINYLVNPNAAKTTEIELSASDYIGYFVKGFLVNFVNPFVFVIWMGVSAKAISSFGNANANLFLSAVLLGILLTDTLKAAFAYKIKPFLNQNTLLYLYKVVGFLLIVFGIIMFYRIS